MKVQNWVVLVAQEVEWSLPTTEVLSSNPNSDVKNNFQPIVIEKNSNKTGRECPIFKDIKNLCLFIKFNELNFIF